MPKGERTSKWDQKHVISIYDLAKSGLSDTKIAEAIGVTKLTMVQWKKKKAEVADALRRGREARKNSQLATKTFQNYVYDRLSPKLKRLYDRIVNLDMEGNNTKLVERILEKRGLRVRQHLFVHAFIKNNFNATEACRFVNIQRDTFTNWCRTDEDFGALMGQMMEAKKDLFESKLIELVQAGDTNAVLFVNKTVNRDRGYGERQEHVHTHAGTITNAHVDVRDLDLPLDTRLQLLQAMRAKAMADGPRQSLPVHVEDAR
jgi:transposase